MPISSLRKPKSTCCKRAARSRATCPAFFAAALAASMALYGCHGSTKESTSSDSSVALSASSPQENSASQIIADQAAQEAQARLDLINQSPAQTVVDVTGLDPALIRNAFHSIELSEEELLAYGDSIYSSDQSFIAPDQLRLVRVLFCDFSGQSRVGELIVNEKIAQDIEEIFYELYQNAYPIDHIYIPVEYGQDDNAIMEADITRAQAFTTGEDGQYQEHEHSLGLAVDLNALYNPQVIVEEESITVLPPAAADYVDRENKRPYMMDENDLAVQLFEQHGFTWGGIWQGRNDYQHFEKGFDHETNHIDPNLHYGAD
ncbi:M15 family metallopeptidase [Erysipelotrichaceae bacterium 51-3]